MTDVTTPPSAAAATAKRNILLLFSTLMIVMLLASLSQMVLSSALPTIVGEMHGVEHMTWVITAYMLASTITMPVYGKISDLVGRKPMLIAAIVLFVAGSVVGGLAQDMNSLIVGRLVQGLGGGGLMILSQAAIADVVPARERGKYMGIMGGVFAVSSVAGPLLGGWLTEGPGWRWAFWMNVPLGILAVVATIVLLRLPKLNRTERPKIDYLGMMLLAIATSTLVLVGTWGGSMYEWGSPQIIGLIIATVVVGALFVLVLFGLWMARGHLKDVVRKAFTGDPSVDDSNECLSYRLAVIGGGLGLLFLLGWLMMIGMAWCLKRTDRLSRAIEVMQVAYEFHPEEPIVLYNLACYYALSDDKGNALSWLGRAVRMEGALRELVAEEADFDTLRHDDDFQLVVGTGDQDVTES